MSWLIFLYSLTLSWVPIYQAEVYDTQLDERIGTNLYFTQIDLDAEIFNNFFIGGKLKTSMKNIVENHTFLPIESSYELHTGFKYNIFMLRYSHQCIHSMAPFEYKINYDSSHNAGYDEFSLTISNNY